MTWLQVVVNIAVSMEVVYIDWVLFRMQGSASNEVAQHVQNSPITNAWMAANSLLAITEIATILTHLVKQQALARKTLLHIMICHSKTVP